MVYVPQALKRKPHRKWNRKNKRMKGRSIDKRPDIVNAGTEIGHWEVDTVVGHRKGHEAVVFTAVEKVTRNYIAIRIPGRTTDGVEVAISQLERLSQSLCTIIFMPNQTFLKIYFQLRMDSALVLSVPCPFLGYIHHS